MPKKDLDTKNETQATSIPQQRHLDTKKMQPKIRVVLILSAEVI